MIDAGAVIGIFCAGNADEIAVFLVIILKKGFAVFRGGRLSRRQMAVNELRVCDIDLAGKCTVIKAEKPHLSEMIPLAHFHCHGVFFGVIGNEIMRFAQGVRLCAFLKITCYDAVTARVLPARRSGIFTRILAVKTPHYVFASGKGVRWSEADVFRASVLINACD